MKFMLVIYLSIQGTTTPWLHHMSPHDSATACRTALTKEVAKLSRYKVAKAECLALPVRLVASR